MLEYLFVDILLTLARSLILLRSQTCFWLTGLLKKTWRGEGVGSTISFNPNSTNRTFYGSVEEFDVIVKDL